MKKRWKRWGVAALILCAALAVGYIGRKNDTKTSPAQTASDTQTGSLASVLESEKQQETETAAVRETTKQETTQQVTQQETQAESENAETDFQEQKTKTPSEKTTEAETAQEKTAAETVRETQAAAQNISVEALLASMTLEEKIGQLFMVAPEGLYQGTSAAAATKLTEEMKETLNRYHIGGIIMMTANVVDPEQITTFMNDLQSSSERGLLIAVDEEGGRVARIANNAAFDVTRFESMEAVGSTQDAKNAYTVGTTIGSYLKKYGFNLDLAPVADVNTNPENIVIGNRSFGSSASLVAQMVAAEIEGLHAENIMTCVKHFPGHGDTTEDTHAGSVSITKTWEEIRDCEILPFAAAIEAGTDLVMVSHIIADQITQDGLPSSMSYEMITVRLRNELGYQGVVITDSMQMGAITRNYSCAESAVTAVKAGVDIILMPADVKEAFNAILNAVANGTVSVERIDESVKRILTLKRKYGIV